jgi:hypothetical protein
MPSTAAVLLAHITGRAIRVHLPDNTRPGMQSVNGLTARPQHNTQGVAPPVRCSLRSREWQCLAPQTAAHLPGTPTGVRSGPAGTQAQDELAAPAKGSPAPQEPVPLGGSPHSPGATPVQLLRTATDAGLRVVTLNVRGLQHSRKWYDMQALAADYGCPGMIALTETKHKRKAALNGCMKQLYTAHSSVSSDGHAGVTLLVARKYSQAHLLQQQDVPQACSGYIVHVTIQLSTSNRLHVVAAYMPVTTTSLTEGQRIDTSAM